MATGDDAGTTGGKKSGGCDVHGGPSSALLALIVETSLDQCVADLHAAAPRAQRSGHSSGALLPAYDSVTVPPIGAVVTTFETDSARPRRAS